MTSEVIPEKPDGCSLAEFVLMNAEENKEQDLVEEFVDIGIRVTEHIMTYLGGQKADKRIVAACRFFSDRDITPTERETWIHANHDRRIFMIQERVEVMNLISILFDQCLRDYWKNQDWMHHLSNYFPKQSLSEIVVRFQIANKKFIREYQNLINQLRLLWGNAMHELGDDSWAW